MDFLRCFRVAEGRENGTQMRHTMDQGRFRHWHQNKQRSARFFTPRVFISLLFKAIALVYKYFFQLKVDSHSVFMQRALVTSFRDQCQEHLASKNKATFHPTPGKFENAASPTVTPTVHSNRSRKSTFFKTLFKPEKFENANFSFLGGLKTFCKRNFFKTPPHDNHVISMTEFISDTNPKCLVIVAFFFNSPSVA